MKLNKKKIERYLAGFKKKAIRSIRKEEFDDALLYITAAANTRYEFYLGFSDEELENDLELISSHLKLKPSFEIKAGKRCVFYSKFTRDAHGLTQQYVDALIKNGYSFLFLHEADIHPKASEDLLTTLNGYKNAESRQIPKGLTRMQKAQWLYDAICDYGADKLLIQMHPSSAYECASFYVLPKTITRYQINITDHTYWIGAGCIDYTIEFRQYGCYVSQEKRGLKTEQILLLPFYPVMNEKPFEGFPVETHGKTVFFSGGSFYKIIDENYTFFMLCRRILEADSKNIIFYAGDVLDEKGLVYINGAINKFGLHNRFILLGHRHDILEVFRNVDIYINTYPFGGGLMCQYAAQCGIPIINYSNANIEGCVSQKHEAHFTYSTMEDFVKEAVLLSTNESYRHKKGEELRSAVITIEDFNAGFEKILLEKRSPFKIDIKEMEEEKLDLDGKIEYHNNTRLYNLLMTNLFGYKSIYVIPGLFLSVAPRIITNKLKRKCKKIFKS